MTFQNEAPADTVCEGPVKSSDSDDKVAQAPPKDHLDRFEGCEDIANHSDILSLFLDTVRRMGSIGEEKPYAILYLAMTSRVFEKIASVFLWGPSSTGKSFAIEQVLKFFPESAYHSVTGMSDKALAYQTESLKHKILVIAEASGIQGGYFQYFLRSLLSEGKIEYETVDSNGGQDRLATRRIQVEGPCGLILSTTEASQHPETDTRAITIRMNDNHRQTRQILDSQATVAAGEAVSNSVSEDELEPFVRLQEALQDGDCEVVIPFAHKLVALIPEVSVRLRRDFLTVIAFIKANALLQQLSRETDSQGRILANRQDYEVVSGLIAEPLAEAVEMTVPGHVQRAVDGVFDLLPPGNHSYVQQNQLAKHLGIDKGTCSRSVGAAIDLGYLINDQDRHGQPTKLRRGNPMPANTGILPDANEIFADQ